MIDDLDDDEKAERAAAVAAAAAAAKSPQRALFAARTRGRELALKYLYQVDLRKDVPPTFDAFATFEDERGTTVDFARRLVFGVLARKAAIDEKLQAVAKNWSLERMAAVDRNVLRLGACEMTMQPPSPPGVAINEAVELGKRYGAAQSGKFINGVLDKLSRLPGFLPATGPDGAAPSPTDAR